MKKPFCLFTIICMGLSLLIFNGVFAEGGTNSGAVLEVSIWDNNQLDGLSQIIDDWSAKTGVKVNINVITWVEYWTLLEAGASGGEMPDVFWMHINEAQKYMRAEKLLNLTKYIAADNSIDNEEIGRASCRERV